MSEITAGLPGDSVFLLGSSITEKRSSLKAYLILSSGWCGKPPEFPDVKALSGSLHPNIGREFYP